MNMRTHDKKIKLGYRNTDIYTNTLTFAWNAYILLAFYIKYVWLIHKTPPKKNSSRFKNRYFKFSISNIEYTFQWNTVLRELQSKFSNSVEYLTPYNCTDRKLQVFLLIFNLILCWLKTDFYYSLYYHKIMRNWEDSSRPRMATLLEPTTDLIINSHKIFPY